MITVEALGVLTGKLSSFGLNVNDAALQVLKCNGITVLKDLLDNTDAIDDLSSHLSFEEKIILFSLIDDASTTASTDDTSDIYGEIVMWFEGEGIEVTGEMDRVMREHCATDVTLLVEFDEIADDLKGVMSIPAANQLYLALEKLRPGLLVFHLCIILVWKYV